MKLREMFKLNKKTGKIEPNPEPVSELNDTKKLDINVGRLYLKAMAKIAKSGPKNKMTAEEGQEWVVNRRMRHGI